MRSSSSASSGETPSSVAVVRAPEDHFALALVIARRAAGGALHARDLAAHRLALGDQLEEVAVDPVQARAQIVQA